MTEREKEVKRLTSGLKPDTFVHPIYELEYNNSIAKLKPV